MKERDGANEPNAASTEPVALQRLTCSEGDVWVYEHCLQSDDSGAFYLDVKAAVGTNVGNRILKDPEFAKDQKLQSRYDDVDVRATIALWINSQFLLEDVPTLIDAKHTMALRFVCTEIVGPEIKKDLYEFILPHVNFGFGDYASGFKAADGRNRIESDHILFVVDGVQWTLRKLFRHDGRIMPAREAFERQANESNASLQSVFSGHAALQVSTSDASRQQAESTAEHICWLLCLAMGQRVAWSELWTRSGADETFLKRRSAALPSALSALRILTNHGGEIQRFLESAYPVYAKHPQWWAETLRWYAVACDSGTVETSAMICSMLLDRVGTHVLDAYRFQKQIGEDLAAALSDRLSKEKLTTELTDLLKTYAAEWEEERSSAILNVIKGWNNSPSFPKKIVTAFELAGLREPPDHVFKPRHTIMHEGTFEEGTVPILQYYQDATVWVVALILHLLGYEGGFSCAGHHSTKTKCFLKKQNKSTHTSAT
jgi:hypothetical protein